MNDVISTFFSFPKAKWGTAFPKAVQSLSHVWLCNSMDCSMPRLPVHYQLPEFIQNSCPLSQWYHPSISLSVIPFSSHLQSFPASGSFLISQFSTSGGQGIGASASVLPTNIQDWFPLGLTSLISLQFKRLSRVFSNTTVQRHQLFGTKHSVFISHSLPPTDSI